MNKEFGAFAPSAFQQKIMGFTRSLPDTWLGRRMGFALRKLVHGGRQEPIDTDVFGLKMRLHPQGNKCEKRVICLPQFFDPEERRILEEFAKKQSGFRFIDLGANIGLYSLFIKSLGLNSKIIAVEADPDIFARLSYNIGLNDGGISAHNIAVSDHDGEAELFINTKNRGESSIVKDQSSGTSIRIPCKTLLSLLDAENITRPDVVKLDLEGAEEIVLKAFFKQAGEERYPKLILIENAPDRWDTDIFALLESKGYELSHKTKTNRVYQLKS